MDGYLLSPGAARKTEEAVGLVLAGKGTYKGGRRERKSVGGGVAQGGLAVLAFATCSEVGSTPGDDFKVVNPWTFTPPDPPDPEEWTLTPFNFGGWDLIQGSVDHLKVLDEEDDPVLIVVQDPFAKAPQTGDLCYIVAPIGESTFRLIERACV